MIDRIAPDGLPCSRGLAYGFTLDELAEIRAAMATCEPAIDPTKPYLNRTVTLAGLLSEPQRLVLSLVEAVPLTLYELADLTGKPVNALSVVRDSLRRKGYIENFKFWAEPLIITYDGKQALVREGRTAPYAGKPK